MIFHAQNRPSYLPSVLYTTPKGVLPSRHRPWGSHSGAARAVWTCGQVKAAREMAAGDARAFGALLKQHRIHAGLTQEERAERAQMSARGVMHLEGGPAPA